MWRFEHSDEEDNDASSDGTWAEGSEDEGIFDVFTGEVKEKDSHASGMVVKFKTSNPTPERVGPKRSQTRNQGKDRSAAAEYWLSDRSLTQITQQRR